MTQAVQHFHQNLDALINGWLSEKQTSKSGSPKTDLAYRSTLNSFRETLQRGDLDLDSADTWTIGQVATMWAAMRAPNAKREGDISPATYNQRLAILSSFYTYCQDQAKQRGLEVINPIKQIKKKKVQEYASAMPLDGDETETRIGTIDRSTLQGKRDYALLLIALTTGRRSSELVSLRWEHIKHAGKRTIVTFEHCKGNKVMRDALDPAVAKALMDYLHAIYGSKLAQLAPDMPIWISFSRRNYRQAISTHTLNDICETYLETSKIHALRHTFAVEMEKAGAPISEISARLGHTDEKITGRYLKQVRSAENPFSGKLAARFGAGK